MSLDLNNVCTKLQLDWPANNRIIAGSLFFQTFENVRKYPGGTLNVEVIGMLIRNFFGEP